MIYWAIYIKPIPQDFEKFILDMAKMYENKYGKSPNICRFSHELPEIKKKIGNISMIYDKYVLKFHFWFAEGKEDEFSLL